MYRHILNKKFKKNNPVKQYTAQQLVYSKLLTPEVMEFASDFTRNIVDRAEDV